MTRDEKLKRQRECMARLRKVRKNACLRDLIDLVNRHRYALPAMEQVYLASPMSAALLMVDWGLDR